jgi:hypothetical protein
MPGAQADAAALATEQHRGGLRMAIVAVEPSVRTKGLSRAPIRPTPLPPTP